MLNVHSTPSTISLLNLGSTYILQGSIAQLTSFGLRSEAIAAVERKASA